METGGSKVFESLGKVARMINVSGTFNGRKRLHKEIHIMKTVGFNFNESFNWGNYGPFSQDVANELQSLTKYGLVCEEHIEENSFRYSMTEDGKEFLVESNVYVEPSFDETVAMLNEKDVGDLELLSTCLFIYKPNESIDKLTDLAHYLKSWYPIEKVRSYNEIAKLIMESETREERIQIIRNELV